MYYRLFQKESERIMVKIEGMWNRIADILAKTTTSNRAYGKRHSRK